MTPGYVLAGGRSRRMGRDKALLKTAPSDPCLAERVARELEAAGCDPVLLVGDLQALQPVGRPVVPDPPTAHHHPLRGVAAALDHARGLGAELAVVVPCDTPDLRAATLSRLMATAGPAVGVAGGRLQPLLARLPTAWSARALQAAEAGASARRFVDRPEVARVEVPVAEARDLDTPADLAAWHRNRTRDE